MIHLISDAHNELRPCRMKAVLLILTIALALPSQWAEGRESSRQATGTLTERQKSATAGQSAKDSTKSGKTSAKAASKTSKAKTTAKPVSNSNKKSSLKPIPANPFTSTTQSSITPPAAKKTPLTPFERQWGIQILSLRQTAKGYMLNFRFRVLDPDKAMGLFDRKTQPYLIDQATGAKFIVPAPPKVGPLRSSGIKPRPNRNFFIFFANPGIYIKRGSKVTIVVGSFKAENIIVE